MRSGTAYEITPYRGLNINLRELWSYRELIYFFAWRDIKVKYKQTALGFAWAVLQPFILMVVFTFFFSHIMKVPSDGIPYPIFAYSGLMIWYIFASGLNHAGNSMVNHAGMIKKIYFPRLVIPVSAVAVALFDFMMALLVYAGILLYYQFPVSLEGMLIYLPLSLLQTIIATLGMGCLLAALNVKYRDFRYLISFIIQLLFFLTPIIYPLSLVGQGWGARLIALNPMTGAVGMARAALAGHSPEWHLTGISVACGLVLLAAGIAYFRKTEAFFADIA